METPRIHTNRLIAAASFGFVLIFHFTLAGCAYRLPPVTLPSQQRLRLIGASSGPYVVRLRIREPRDYPAPPDGRVTLDVPAYRAACSVYLFDKLRIHGGADPFTAKVIDVVVDGKIVRQLSLEKISALPVDSEGYHLLPVRPAK